MVLSMCSGPGAYVEGVRTILLKFHILRSGYRGRSGGVILNAVVQRKSCLRSGARQRTIPAELAREPSVKRRTLSRRPNSNPRPSCCKPSRIWSGNKRRSKGNWPAKEKRILQREEQLDRKLSAVDKRDAEAQKRDALLTKRQEAMAVDGSSQRAAFEGTSPSA